ncbi:hypothetical protein [Streptomyces buecherae]|uniref:hypothetical protein n=1 Tax=Streptomyces buecherae TaxID=2763006 RepID=UPI003663C0CD
MDLLVVDWDFFFPTPAAGGPLGDHPELFAWPVTEDPVHVEAIWLKRLRAFVAAGVKLPWCVGYEGFWGRFNISVGAKVFYADSNAWASQIFPSNLGGSGPWRSVHLYDAHHDCGYKRNDRSFAAWKRGVLSGEKKISAENWMLAHYWNGSRVFVHFPPWRESLARPVEEPLIPLSMRIDKGPVPQVAFDAVFLSRSGAWVPSWCDDQFAEFLHSCPACPVEVVGNAWKQPRDDVRMIQRLWEKLLSVSSGG